MEVHWRVVPGTSARTRSRALGAWAVALTMAGMPGCGRIGYALLSDDGVSPPDAAVARGGTVDGSKGTAAAPIDASVDAEAPPDEAADDAFDGVLDAAPDAAADATDSAPDAIADVAAETGPAADAMCAVSAVVNYCSAIPPLPAPPVIDG